MITNHHFNTLFCLQWSPGDPAAGGQVSAVRPRPVGAGQGHHDLHAPDKVHVQQPRQRAAAPKQEAESVRSLLCTAHTKSPQTFPYVQ